MKIYNSRCLWPAVFLFVFAAAGIFQPLQASETSRTQIAEPPTLKFIAHAFVKISTTAGTIIYIDPFQENEFADSADIVLITHEHNDHRDLSRIRQKASCQVIRAADAQPGGVYQSFVIGDVKILAVPAYNANHAKNVCVGYVLEFDNIKLYHAGDTGKIAEMADLAALQLDYALVPMEGVFTMTPEIATEAAALIQAKHDIPIHTMPSPDTYSEAIVARFASPNKLVVRHGETIELEPGTTVVKDNGASVEKFALEPNFPNPFNASTTITYHLPESGNATLKVYNFSGQELETLVDGYQSQGEHRVVWQPAYLASGLYLVRLQAGVFSETKKVVLQK